MDLPRSILVAILDAIESDPDLRERARKVLGVEAPRTAYVTRVEARKLGVEMRVLLRAERAGTLQAFRAGRSVTYRVEDVRKLVEGHPVMPRSPAPAPRGAEVESSDEWDRAVARAAKRRASGR